MCWHKWEKAKVWTGNYTLYVVYGFECKKCKERKIKEHNESCGKPDMLDAAVEWKNNRPQKSTVLKMVKDMEVLDKFLKPKGRFVGDMVHISIADLADCFHTRAPQWQTIDSAPRDGTNVLLSDNHEIIIGKWCEWREYGQDYAWYDSQCIPIEATHWQPLPLPQQVLNQSEGE